MKHYANVALRMATVVLVPSILLQGVFLVNFLIAERKTPFSTVYQLNRGNEEERVLFFPDYLSMGYLAHFEERINRQTIAYFIEGNYNGVFRDFGNNRRVSTNEYLLQICKSSRNIYLVTHRRVADSVIAQKLGTVDDISGRALVPEEGSIFKIKLNPSCEKDVEKLFQIFRIFGNRGY